LTQLMEAAGIAPASRDPLMKASTCVSDSLIVGLGPPIGGVTLGLSHHEFNPSRNGRLGSDDPALASSGEASGRRPATKPFLLKQPYGERESSRQINFGPLFTRPADQPRHATIHVSNPVDPGSPPIVKERRRNGLCKTNPLRHNSLSQLSLRRAGSQPRSRPQSSGRSRIRRLDGSHSSRLNATKASPAFVLSLPAPPAAITTYCRPFT
jgi:hypothetical protein